jgi:hypothetical protein
LSRTSTPPKRPIEKLPLKFAAGLKVTPASSALVRPPIQAFPSEKARL